MIGPVSTTHSFFKCYRCAEWLMAISPYGIHCQGCQLRSFVGPGERRIVRECEAGHPEMVTTSTAARCLVCVAMGVN